MLDGPDCSLNNIFIAALVESHNASGYESGVLSTFTCFDRSVHSRTLGNPKGG